MESEEWKKELEEDFQGKCETFVLGLVFFSFIFLVEKTYQKVCYPILIKYNGFVSWFNTLYPEYIVWGGYTKPEKPKTREELGLPPRCSAAGSLQPAQRLRARRSLSHGIPLMNANVK